MGNNSPEKHSYQSLLKWTCQLLGAQRRYPFLFLSCLSVLMSLCSVCPTVFQTESSFLFWTHKGSCEGCLVLWDSPRLLLFHPHLFLISHLPLWARSLSSASPCRVVFFFFSFSNIKTLLVGCLDTDSQCRDPSYIVFFRCSCWWRLPLYDSLISIL